MDNGLYPSFNRIEPEIEKILWLKTFLEREEEDVKRKEEKERESPGVYHGIK